MSRTRRASLAALALAAIAVSGCAHHKKSISGLAPPPPVRTGYAETGVASWYGYPYHGRAAADGEIYDMEKMVAAHRTLPFNTWVRVENLSNRKTVEVRIIDRGPFVDGRIIDLSRAAARQIDLLGPGTARVRLVVIDEPRAGAPALYGVQVGAFAQRANADRLRARMAAQFGAAKVVERAGSPTPWRVLVGAESTEDAATALAGRIRENSSEKNPGFVVRLDSK
jgi:rare lipoprotein A